MLRWRLLKAFTQNHATLAVLAKAKVPSRVATPKARGACAEAAAPADALLAAVGDGPRLSVPAHHPFPNFSVFAGIVGHYSDAGQAQPRPMLVGLILHAAGVLCDHLVKPLPDADYTHTGVNVQAGYAALGIKEKRTPTPARRPCQSAWRPSQITSPA